VAFFRAALENHFPEIRSTLGTLDGNVDLIPKSVYERIPLLMTGRGRQELEWIAAETDGWMYYTPPFQQQAQTIQQWRRLTDGRGPRGFKPFAQATVIDLRAEPHASPRRIHQGFSVGREPLLEMMGAWQQVGIDQLMINFKHNHRPVAEVLDELAEYVLPEFPPGRAEDAAAADRGRSA
jgi:luciferase-type oxidoreductase